MPRSAKGSKRFIILVVFLLFSVQVSVFVLHIQTALSGDCDFGALYRAASMVRAGNARDLYDPNINQEPQKNLKTAAAPADRLAYETLLFIPFTPLKYRTAYFVFLAINLALISFAIWMIWAYLEKLPRLWSWFPPTLFFCFLFTALAIVQGADSIVLLTLVLASAVLFFCRKEWSSGILLGLGLFNFQLVVPIALLFLCWRRWRIIAGFIITGSVAVGLSVILTRCVPFRGYSHPSISCNAQFVILAGQMREEVNTASLPNLRCLLNSVVGAQASPDAVLILAAIGSILILLWAASRPPSYALAILVALLVSQYERVQDGVLLIIPIAFVLDARIEPTLRTQEWSRNIASLLFVAPTIIYLIGWRYCILVPLMLALLIPLRSTRWGYDLPAPS